VAFSISGGGPRLRIRLAETVNGWFGTPTRISRESYDRLDRQFDKHTANFLAVVSNSVPADADVLIVGCGDGSEIEWFAERCRSVVAVDVMQDSVARCAQRSMHLTNVECRLVGAKSLPFGDVAFDVLFMHNVCEHIIEVEACFAEYYRILKKGGLLMNTFAPLFYSPFGAHLIDALKMPWFHLAFGLDAVSHLRNQYYPKPYVAKSWADHGLNRITERRYRRMVDRLGFHHERYEVACSGGLSLAAGIPLLRNLFIFRVTDVLRK
jgi:ubiquinone/menaquinone biosynthesis C-methylase UbiE